MSGTFNVYKAKDGWRWKLKKKGRIIAESGEAYVKKPDIAKLCAKLVHDFYDAHCVDESK